MYRSESKLEKPTKVRPLNRRSYKKSFFFVALPTSVVDAVVVVAVLSLSVMCHESFLIAFKRNVCIRTRHDSIANKICIIHSHTHTHTHRWCLVGVEFGCYIRIDWVNKIQKKIYTERELWHGMARHIPLVVVETEPHINEWVDNVIMCLLCCVHVS